MLRAKKIGFFGAGRGSYYIKGLSAIDDMEAVAVCDKDNRVLDNLKKDFGNKIKYYTDFDEFIEETDMDGVVLCNYFHEHASYAIKAMERGIAVLSETAAGGTMQECVELVEAAQRTGVKYMLSENYPYMRGVQELRRLYTGGTFGKVMYAEGEYVHPVSDEEGWALSPGERHWRRFIPATYYLTHSLGPLMYATGQSPININARVIANDREDDIASGKTRQNDPAAIMLCETDGGAIFRITGCAAFGPHGNWYRLACQNGGMETVRFDEARVMYGYNNWCVPENTQASRIYRPDWPFNNERAESTGHGGSDYWVLYYFGEYLNRDIQPYFDVYKAAVMSAAGILGWRSCLKMGALFDIPDFSKPTDREKWRYDDLTPFPDKNMSKTLPSSTYDLKHNKYKMQL